MLDKLFHQYVGRLVAFVVTPILLPVVPVVTNALNSVLGTGLNDQQVMGVAIAEVVGLAAVIYKWLSNRGAHEVAAIEAQLSYLQKTGQQLTVKGGPHVTPDA